MQEFAVGCFVCQGLRCRSPLSSRKGPNADSGESLGSSANAVAAGVPYCVVCDSF